MAPSDIFKAVLAPLLLALVCHGRRSLAQCPRSCRCDGRWQEAVRCTPGTFTGVPQFASRMTTLHFQGNAFRFRNAAAPFRNYSLLTSLDLCGSDFTAKGIYALSSSIFQGLKALTQLHLSSCDIGGFQEGTFNALSSLRSLDLSANDLPGLNASNLQLKRLDFLNLSGNQLGAVDGSFDGLPALRVLDLSKNGAKSRSGLRFTNAHVFAANPLLRKLFLQENKIAQLPVGIFDALVQLQVLNISWNRLSQLPRSVFLSMHGLISLDISHNGFVNLGPDVILGPNLVYVNALVSSVTRKQVTSNLCAMTSLLHWHRRKQGSRTLIVNKFFRTALTNLSCQSGRLARCRSLRPQPYAHGHTAFAQRLYCQCPAGRVFDGEACVAEGSPCAATYPRDPAPYVCPAVCRQTGPVDVCRCPANMTSDGHVCRSKSRVPTAGAATGTASDTQGSTMQRKPTAGSLAANGSAASVTARPGATQPTPGPSARQRRGLSRRRSTSTARYPRRQPPANPTATATTHRPALTTPPATRIATAARKSAGTFPTTTPTPTPTAPPTATPTAIPTSVTTANSSTLTIAPTTRTTRATGTTPVLNTSLWTSTPANSSSTSITDPRRSTRRHGIITAPPPSAPIPGSKPGGKLTTTTTHDSVASTASPERPTAARPSALVMPSPSTMQTSHTPVPDVSNSSTTFIAAGAGGGFALLLLLGTLIMIRRRRARIEPVPMPKELFQRSGSVSTLMSTTGVEVGDYGYDLTGLQELAERMCEDGVVGAGFAGEEDPYLEPTECLGEQEYSEPNYCSVILRHAGHYADTSHHRRAPQPSSSSLSLRYPPLPQHSPPSCAELPGHAEVECRTDDDHTGVAANSKAALAAACGRGVGGGDQYETTFDSNASEAVHAGSARTGLQRVVQELALKQARERQQQVERVEPEPGLSDVQIRLADTASLPTYSVLLPSEAGETSDCACLSASFSVPSQVASAPDSDAGREPDRTLGGARLRRPDKAAIPGSRDGAPSPATAGHPNPNLQVRAAFHLPAGHSRSTTGATTTTTAAATPNQQALSPPSEAPIPYSPGVVEAPLYACIDRMLASPAQQLYASLNAADIANGDGYAAYSVAVPTAGREPSDAVSTTTGNRKAAASRLHAPWRSGGKTKKNKPALPRDTGRARLPTPDVSYG